MSGRDHEFEGGGPLSRSVEPVPSTPGRLGEEWRA